MITKWIALAPMLGALVTTACMQMSERYVAPGATELPTPASFERVDNACLPNNRIWGWRVLDERTLVVNDLGNRPFLVRMSGGCVGLTNANIAIAFRTSTRLGCLRRGDEVIFRDRTLGVQSCFVTDVEPYPTARLAYDIRPYTGTVE